MIKLLYKFFFELAEGLNPRSHYHIKHNHFGIEHTLVPIETDKNSVTQTHYHQTYHS